MAFIDDIIVTGNAIPPPVTGGGGGGGGGGAPEPEPELLCTENWVCGEWNACYNGLQDRICRDQNNCGTLLNHPGGSQECEVEEETTPTAETTTAPTTTPTTPTGFAAITGAVIGPGGAPTPLGFIIVLALIAGSYLAINAMRRKK